MAPSIAFIGCGNMGSAILGGLLSATRTSDTNAKFSKFIINTKSASSAERLRAEYKTDAARLDIRHGQNVAAMQDADVVLLACKPFLVAGILSEPGVRSALAGKFVISILAGMSPQEIAACIDQPEGGAGASPTANGDSKGTRNIVRAMPNVAARLRQSMTIIEADPTLSTERSELLTWMFEQIGRVKYVAAEQFDAAGMLVGASMAMFTVPLDGLLDGCVVEGLRRPEALEMAAQVLEGMAALLKDGAHPAVLRESIASPRGCTIQGLMTVERRGVRAAFADGMIDGTEHLK
ncbi:pyrroline-5-carboxylate reductase dimerization-domain-containing protein [Aspergillus floccosus]